MMKIKSIKPTHWSNKVPNISLILPKYVRSFILSLFYKISSIGQAIINKSYFDPFWPFLHSIPPNLASSELSTCSLLILWKISEKANTLILSKAVKSPITVSSYVGSPLHFFKKSWLPSPSPPFAFPSIFGNFVFPPFYWSPSKMQKRSFPPSESFKLLLLACQCGHTIEEGIHTKIKRCVKMFLLLTNKVYTMENEGFW